MLQLETTALQTSFFCHFPRLNFRQVATTEKHTVRHQWRHYQTGMKSHGVCASTHVRCTFCRCHVSDCCDANKFDALEALPGFKKHCYLAVACHNRLFQQHDCQQPPLVTAEAAAEFHGLKLAIDHNLHCHLSAEGNQQQQQV